MTSSPSLIQMVGSLRKAADFRYPKQSEAVKRGEGEGQRESGKRERKKK